MPMPPRSRSLRQVFAATTSVTSRSALVSTRDTNQGPGSAIAVFHSSYRSWTTRTTRMTARSATLSSILGLIALVSRFALATTAITCLQYSPWPSTSPPAVIISGHSYQRFEYLIESTSIDHRLTAFWSYYGTPKLKKSTTLRERRTLLHT
ncbi:hypothetical protein CC79DRAFT_1152062 [Sarocladium strictum]